MKRLIIFPICWIITIVTFSIVGAQEKTCISVAGAHSYIEKNTGTQVYVIPTGSESDFCTIHPKKANERFTVRVASGYDLDRVKRGYLDVYVYDQNEPNDHLVDQVYWDAEEDRSGVVFHDVIELKIITRDGDIPLDGSSSKYAYGSPDNVMVPDPNTPNGKKILDCAAQTPGIRWSKAASSFSIDYTTGHGNTRSAYETIKFLVVDNQWFDNPNFTVPLCHRDPVTYFNLVPIPDQFASANINAGTQQTKGNDHGSSPDQAQLKEDVTPSSSTQTPSPVDDSPTTRRGESQQQYSAPTVPELEAMVMDLQAKVTRLTDLVTRLLKENAELRHDNAVLSMMVDANQDDGDIIDEIVDDEATDTTDTPQQDTHVDDSVSTHSTQSTPTYDLSGYQYADIAPDGRPRITSTAATHSHPPTRKVFLNEWARFYDEHHGIEWWDCAGWTMYEDPVVDVPMSSINANPNEYCDLRNSEE